MTNSVNSAKDLDSILFDISPKIKELAGLCEANTGIDKELFVKHDVKRGLRDVNGKGVLAGLTNISDVCAKKIVNGEEVPCAGNLYYRGYNIVDSWMRIILDMKKLHICFFLVNFRRLYSWMGFMRH